jgi:hypothetical protein
MLKLEMTVGYIMELPCKQKHVATVAAGAVVAYAGLDTLLPFPPIVHYIAAGVLVDSMCRGRDIIDGTKEIVVSGGLAWGGAYAVSWALRGGSVLLF